MPTTAFLGLSVQTAGSNSGVWGAGNAGVDLNTGVFQTLDNRLGSPTTLSLASTTPVALTATQAQSGMLIFTGTLLANIAVTTTALGAFWVENRTSGAFTVSLSNGTGNPMLVPQGAGRQVWSDSTYGVRALNLPAPGSFLDLGATTPHVSLLATASLNGEYVLCFGQSLATATYPALFSAIGYTWGGSGANFTVPDLRGTGRFGKDNMGGSARGLITAAGSGIDGTTVGTEGGAQNVTIARSGLPNVNIIIDPGHLHNIKYSTSARTAGGVSTVQDPLGSGNLNANTDSATTGITGYLNGNVTQTATVVMPPVGIVNVLIKV